MGDAWIDRWGGDLLELERTEDPLDLEFADKVAGIFRDGLFEVSVA